jgi:hypothetical protein
MHLMGIVLPKERERGIWVILKLFGSLINLKSSFGFQYAVSS